MIKRLNIFKGTPLRLKSLKTKKLNFLHRSSLALLPERYAKDIEKIYSE
jgi:hypothetical protein